MSTFEVKVVKIDSVEKHPNADRLTIVKVGGYTCISNLTDEGNWRYHPGDLAVYIPADSLLPEWFLKKMGYWKEDKNIGTLFGSRGNRVKAIRLRGVFSEGLLYPVIHNKLFSEWPSDYSLSKGSDGFSSTIPVKEGDNVAEFLNIVKYEPPIPTNLAGEVFSITKVELMERHGLVDMGQASYTPVKYDVEAWEKYPKAFMDGEEVVITEKLHGTACGFGVFPDLDHPETFLGYNKRNIIVYSKGLGGKGLCMKDNEQNAHNVYANVVRNLPDETKMKLTNISECYNGIHILGEIFGRGVQDLHYGQNTPSFRVYDIYLGRYPFGKFVNHYLLESFLKELTLPRVPVLEIMPFDLQKVLTYRDGNDTIAGQHIREGVVVRPVVERQVASLPNSRLQLKFVGEAYKLRKGNVTEYQ